ncbi:MAG: shikimate kinase [Clostridia bacterium]|nr:shikimate kinase [Clostridia bacterium]
MKNIVLTGFMASGKSTVGAELAKITARPLIDTDILIEQEAGMSISDIFATYGEEYFRDLETVACMTAAEENGAIISTGGGAVLRKENIDALRKNGVIFNLEMNEELIAQRMDEAKGTRPLMSDELSDIIARFNSRKEFYAGCDYKIPVYDGKTPTELAAEILKLYTMKTQVLDKE